MRSSSSGACSDSASVTGMPSSASWLIRGTRPDGRDRDAARGHAQAVGGRVGEPSYGADDRLVVGHRLAHAHEDHVVHAAGAAGDLVAGQRPGAGDDLLDDLGGGHVALQAALAGGAERAGHAAAGLRGDAHRHAVGVAHQHRLDQRTVEELPQRLAGGALVGLHRAQRRHQRRQQRLDEPLALGGRQVGHLGRVVDEPGEVVRGQLLGPEPGQTGLGDQRLALGGGEVGEVPRRLLAAARLVEHQGQGLDRLRHLPPSVPPGHPWPRILPVRAWTHPSRSTTPATPAAPSSAR